MPALRILNVAKSFGSTDVLKNITIEIDPGEFLILVGPSGCGKSTLLNCLAGLEDVTSGEIWMGERMVNAVSPKDRDIAMVFQSYALYPNMDVRGNISFGMEMRRVPKAQQEAKIKEIAHMLQMEHLLARKPGQLSGGQRQRVAMGRALARNPSLFLFDEPLSNLDAKLRVAMRAEIKALHQRLKTTTVYVTHDQIEAMTMADRIVVMHDGIVEQIGTPLELFDHPGNLFVAQFIGSPSMNVLKGTLRQAEGREWVEALGQRWPSLPHLQASDGQSVHYGLRPTDITLSASANGIPAKVIVVEPTGAETELLLEVSGAQLVLVMHGRTLVKPDDTVHLEIAADKTHLFDSASEKRLTAA